MLLHDVKLEQSVNLLEVLILKDSLKLIHNKAFSDAAVAHLNHVKVAVFEVTVRKLSISSLYLSIDRVKQSNQEVLALLLDFAELLYLAVEEADCVVYRTILEVSLGHGGHEASR